MTPAEALDAVFEKTGRRALTTASQNALLEAARYYHSVENWPRDRVENTYNIPAPGYRITLAEATVFPNLRVLEYVRKWDPTGTDPLTGQPTGAAGAFFDDINTSTLLDGYGRERTEVMWQAGTNHVLVSSTSLSAIKFAYFQWPTLTPFASLNSWMLTHCPQLLYIRAALTICMDTGDKERVAMLRMSDTANYVTALASYMKSTRQ